MRRAKYRADLRVDDYIKSLPSWQQEVCWQVRDPVHAADKDVSETIKRTKLPYFTLDGNICALLGAKDHVNISTSSSMTRSLPTLKGSSTRDRAIPLHEQFRCTKANRSRSVLCLTSSRQ